MTRDRNKQKENLKPGRTQFIMMFFAFSFGMILSNLIAQSSAQKTEKANAPLFVYQGIDKTLEDISPTFRERIVSLDQKKQHTLELAAIELHVHQYANDKGISIDQAGEELFPASKNEELERQASEFYRENEQALNKPFYQVRDDIRARLEYQNIMKMKQNLLASLKESGNLAILPAQ
jgi:hypothetical protein